MSTLTSTYNVPVVQSSSLDSYLQTIAAIPVLEAEEERQLAIKWHEEQDLDAARQLVLGHLKFVVHIARNYSGYGLPLADLIQEGNIGLMKAVRRFDPAANVRLISYAVHWIKAEIHEFVLRNWRMVKVATTKAQRKLFFNLRSSKKDLGWLNQEEAELIADELGVSMGDVFEMESRLSSRDNSFDAFSDEDEEHYSAPINTIADIRYEPSDLVATEELQTQHQSSLIGALDGLDERSKDIIESRWLKEPKATLKDLAGKYGVSHERIRQIEENAIKKLRSAMT